MIYVIQFEPPQTGNHWTLDLPDHEKFGTIGGPQNTLYIHVLCCTSVAVTLFEYMIVVLHENIRTEVYRKIHCKILMDLFLQLDNITEKMFMHVVEQCL